MCQQIPVCTHVCIRTIAWRFRKFSHMGRSKAQRAIPVTLALVSNTSMSTSKYEGCFKGLQMGDQQKLEKKMYQDSLFFSRCPSTYHEQLQYIVNHSFAVLWSGRLSLIRTVKMPAWPHLTSLSLLPSRTLPSVWSLYWGMKGIWSQTQVQTAHRTCHESGTKQDHTANWKPTEWPQFS